MYVAPNSVSGRGEDAQRSLHAIERELDLGADRAPDPVLLHLERAGRPIDQRQVLQQAIGVGRDLEHPLPHRPPDHREAADLAQPVDDLLVGEHRSERRAPVDRNLGDVRQPALEQLEEDPLRPAVVIGIGGVDLAFPVVREPDALHLAPEGVDVLRGSDRGVHPGLDGVLFGRQTEGVPAHRVQHVESAHALVARDDVGGGVALEMADVQPRARGVREHVHAVELGPRAARRRAEGGAGFPGRLPFGLGRGERIAAHLASGPRADRPALTTRVACSSTATTSARPRFHAASPR
jgi:hypothetical protein